MSIASHNKNTNTPTATRDRLIEEAIHLFAQKSYAGVSVKAIAAAAGVNISLISYHFGGKEGLYRTCLETFGKDRLNAAERILQPAQSADEFALRLKMFLNELLFAHFEHPEITRIIHRDISEDTPLVHEIFRHTFFKSFQKVLSFFQAAQNSGLLKKTIEPLTLATLAFGGLLRAAQMDHIGQEFFSRSLKDSEVRDSLIEQTVALLLEGALATRATEEKP